MRIAHRKDYIDEKEFNRMVEGAGMPVPDEDSKDDSAVDEETEIEMGEDYPDSKLDAETEEDEENTEQRINQAAGDRFSSWPDPSQL
jgi:hypothetical protein